uniref:Uncharacterized protein n=1 Tax=Knipowitschia caucasica TaxID=637954 RepID=A0AAV2JSG3_KNICA
MRAHTIRHDLFPLAAFDAVNATRRTSAAGPEERPAVGKVRPITSCVIGSDRPVKQLDVRISSFIDAARVGSGHHGKDSGQRADILKDKAGALALNLPSTKTESAINKD